MFQQAVQRTLHGVREFAYYLVDSKCEQRQKRERYFNAVIAGDTATVSLLISQGVSVNAVEPQEQLSAIHLAIAGNHIDLTESLLANPSLDISNCARTNNKGYTILHTAVCSHRLELVKRLYKSHPHLLNVQDKDGRSVLHVAVCSQSGVSMINFLLSVGVDKDLLDNKRRTALMEAVLLPNDTLFTRLITLGADVNEPYEYYSCSSALALAIEYQKLELVRKLLQLGAMTESGVQVTMTYRDYSLKCIHARDTRCMKSQNLATLAIKNIFIDGTVRSRDSIDIACELIIASLTPPDAEAVFQMYGRYIVKSKIGQPRNAHDDIDCSLANNTPSDEVTDVLLWITAASFSTGEDWLPHKDKLRQRYRFDDERFNALVSVYEHKSLNRRRAIFLRKKVDEEGCSNIVELINTGKFNAQEINQMKLTWCYEEDKKCLDSRPRCFAPETERATEEGREAADIAASLVCTEPELITIRVPLSEEC